MPDEKQFPAPRFVDHISEAEDRERAFQARRERSRAKVAKHFPAGTEIARKAEARLGMKVRIVGMIEDGKIVGRIDKHTLADMEQKNGGPLKRIDPDPDKED